MNDMRADATADRAVTVDLRNVRRIGERFWNRVHLTPLQDASAEDPSLPVERKQT